MQSLTKLSLYLPMFIVFTALACQLTPGGESSVPEATNVVPAIEPTSTERVQPTEVTIETNEPEALNFVNGGGFVIIRLMFEMNDVFAAFSVSGTALWHEVESDLLDQGLPLDLYIVIGTLDDKLSENLGHPKPFPIAPEAILNDSLFGPMLSNTAALLSLSDTHTVESQPPFSTFTYSDSLVGADNVFKFRMVKGMFHIYNNGEKIPQGFDAAALFWEFFQQHPLN